ncbi:MAG: sulfurtransferase TusA family protein [Actinobacteria bacterium]|nr:sulfurtransferase TusA family protein [Actinomycetota bacterium]
MAEEYKVALELDLKGLLCPLPMVRVSQNIKNVPVGGIIRAVATDVGSLADIPSWARSTGNEVLKTDRVEKEITFYIKRVK